MTIIKRSDVKNYLSTRARAVALPFTPTSQTDAAGDSRSELRGAEPNVPGFGNPAETQAVKNPQA
jgi:hypothetical protein